MRRWRTYSAILITLTMFHAGSRAQQGVDEKSADYTQTLVVYQRMIGDQAGIYNGPFYYAYPEYLHSGSPFFLNSSPINGNVLYNGTWYKNVPLLYDEITDQLVTWDYKRINLIQLIRTKVDSFQLGNYVFARIAANPTNTASSGFYQVLYSGNISVFKKEVKTVRKQVKQFEVSRTVEAESRYFVKLDNEMHSINNNRALLNLFGKHAKEIRMEMKKKKLNFRTGKEQYIIDAVSFFEHLRN